MLDSIGSVASIIAAVASVVLFLYFMWDRRYRVRIKVFGNLVEIPSTVPERKMVSVEVINVGSRPVAIDKVFLYGPEDKLVLMKDSMDRPDAQKLLTPENPNVTFLGSQDAINPASLIAVIAYDRADRMYVYHVQRRAERIKRWFRLRLTRAGRVSRKLLVQVNLRRV